MAFKVCRAPAVFGLRCNSSNNTVRPWHHGFRVSLSKHWVPLLKLLHCDCYFSSRCFPSLWDSPGLALYIMKLGGSLKSFPAEDTMKTLAKSNTTWINYQECNVGCSSTDRTVPSGIHIFLEPSGLILRTDRDARHLWRPEWSQER